MRTKHGELDQCKTDSVIGALFGPKRSAIA
jgi:hypothetical protein